MARKALIHKHTNLTTDNGGVLSPKLPTAGTLLKGEIAVNYKDGYETLSIENDAGEVIPFASLEQTMAYTDASVVNADWNATSGKAEILNKPDIPDEKLSSSYQTSTLENENLLLAGGDTYETAFSKMEKAILDNEETIAASLNDLNTRKIEIDDVPTKTSQLTNDSNFTTLSEVTLTIVNSAPTTLDTLNELATALGNDPNFATTIATQIGNKADKSSMTAGTYRSVTVNNQGIVIGGTNPTTLAGYSITNAVTLNTEQIITGKKLFYNSELEIWGGEFKFNYHIERRLRGLSTNGAYANWDSEKKDGTWHRIWRVSFPEGSNFWGKITIGFCGTYSSFNASGYIEKEICVAFNGSSLYNNVGRYSALGLNVEKDFRISELVWNSETNQWQILIYSHIPNGNNWPQEVIIKCETANNNTYTSTFEGITVSDAEVSQISSYVNTKATVNGTSKTFYFADLPVYQDPYGDEIAVIDDIPTKTSQLTNDSGFLTSHQLLKTINNESLIGSGNITIQGGGGDTNIIETVKVNGTALTPDANKAVDITVPAAITESTVSGWGFTKNTGTYSIPSGGIPASDLANSVQTSLGKADTALQSFTESDPTVPSHVKEITTTDISNWNNKLSSAPVTSVNGQTGVVNLTIPSAPGTLNTTATTAQSTSSSEALSGNITLHKVAKTGTYSDLIGTPTIPAAVTENTVSGWGFTKNEGTITGITMNGSSKGTSGVVNLGTVLTEHQTLKTINSESIVGTGNLTVSGLPTVTVSDNGKILQVVNGAWTLATPTAIYSGTSTPNNSTGNDGDLYLQTS